jgi:N-acetylglucosamine kinase-like BadF-type ATPase
MSSPDLYLAIDCGGTKTVAVLCTPEGTILARALGGGSNFSYLGLDAFLKRIAEVTSSALSTALQSSVTITPPMDPQTHITGTPPYNLHAAWLGIAGVDSPSAASLLLPHVSTLLSVPVERLIVSNDTHLLAAPLRILPDVRTAVAVVAGTGSIVVSFREGAADAPLDALARVGGWGWILGDEGGGFDVGRTAVRALLSQQDMGTTGAPVAHGPLREKLLKKFGVDEVMDLFGVVYAPDSTSPVPREGRLSSLCPIVFEAAFEDRDPLAIQVVKDCAQKLALQIVAVLHTSEQEVHAFLIVRVARIDRIDRRTLARSARMRVSYALVVPCVVSTATVSLSSSH